jgi:hypothetical protein
VHWTGGYGARFQAISLAPTNSIKMALSHPSRQPVTQAVGRLKKVRIIETRDRSVENDHEGEVKEHTYLMTVNFAPKRL